MISDSKSLASFIKKQKITAVKPKVHPVTFYKRIEQHYFLELSGKMKDCLEIFGHVILPCYIIWQSRWGEVVAFGNIIKLQLKMMPNFWFQKRNLLIQTYDNG